MPASCARNGSDSEFATGEAAESIKNARFASVRPGISAVNAENRRKSVRRLRTSRAKLRQQIGILARHRTKCGIRFIYLV